MNAITTTMHAEEGGWLDGAPLAVSSEAVHIDLTAYRRMRCPACRKRGMKVVPQHTAAGAYRVPCSCKNCRHAEAG